MNVADFCTQRTNDDFVLSASASASLICRALSGLSLVRSVRGP